ncbi:MAG: radical SAM protein, partial [Candidatus Omnitrophota bacterium]
MKTHYTIPFFIPHEGCPFRCVFCDQGGITGEKGVDPGEVAEKIEKYLATIPSEGVSVEVGFFGGTFTGIPRALQDSYLEAVQEYFAAGRIQGIRLSTRPDYIDEDTLEFLKHRRVTCIELGVQSMSDSVLAAAGRGYMAADVERASRMISGRGFLLVHQMMLGLPGSTFEEEWFTAHKAKELGALQVRIYPVIVMKGTALAVLWKAGKYAPLSEEEAVRRCAEIILYFELNGIRVIRCGLHPSEGLLDGSAWLAGPFHPALRQKAESRIFGLLLERALEKAEDGVQDITYNPLDEAAFFGYEKENLSLINRISGDGRCSVRKDGSVPRRSIK